MIEARMLRGGLPAIILAGILSGGACHVPPVQSALTLVPENPRRPPPVVSPKCASAVAMRARASDHFEQGYLDRTKRGIERANGLEKEHACPDTSNLSGELYVRTLLDLGELDLAEQALTQFAPKMGTANKASFAEETAKLRETAASHAGIPAQTPSDLDAQLEDARGAYAEGKFATRSTALPKDLGYCPPAR